MEKTLKIVLTCGHPNSGFQLAHAALIAAGLAQAQPSRRESLSTAEFQEKIFRAYDQDPAGLSTTEQLSPGKIWEELAVDLFMGNMDQEAWGWADARTVWLLDFWKAFDPQICFVLIYSSPEFAVGQALMNKLATPAEIDRVITSWTAYNSEILRFYNRHPDQCLLANVAAAIHTPAQFVEQTANTLGIRIELDASYQADRSSVSAIASSLAKALIEDCDEAIALYRELESSANLDSGSASISEAENCQAWQDYSTLLSEIDQAVAVASELQARIEQLTHVRDEQAGLAAEQTLLLEAAWNQMEAQVVQLQGELHQSVGEHDRQTERLTELQRQLTHLTNERDEHSRVSLERLAHIEQLTQARDEQARLAAERQTQIEQLAVQLGDARMSLVAKQSEIVPTQPVNTELMQENELLLLQLHQVQEELEHCFLQNQNFTGMTQSVAFTTEFWRIHQPAEIDIDMRDEIEGDNWYHAEHDGRWAGPGELSTLRLPALRDGRYEVRLYVVDAKEPEILAGMEVSLNGMPLEMEQVGEDVSALIYAQFSTRAITKSPVWEFQFKFPKLISPAQHGTGDQRTLAIRLQSLKLSSIE